MLERLVSLVEVSRRENDGMPVETLVEVDRRWWQVGGTSLPLVPYSSTPYPSRRDGLTYR